MSKTGIYENLPLKPLNIDDNVANAERESLLKSQKTKNALKPKKRKSTPEIIKVSPQNNIPKQSRSVAEISNNLEENDLKVNSSSSETLKAGNDGSSSNYEISPRRSKEEEDGTKVYQKTTVHSTPTSTLDDGYESCNSTPHGSGMF